MNFWMQRFLRIKNLIKAYKPISFYAFILICLFILIFLFKKILYNNAHNFYFIQTYYKIVLKISIYIYNLLGYSMDHIRVGSILSFTGASPDKYNIKLLALRQTLIFITVAILIPLELKKKIKLILFIILLFQVLIVSRIVALSICFYSSNKLGTRIISEISILIMNISLFYLFYYWFRSDFRLRKLLIFKLKLSKTTLKHVFIKVFYCILALGLVNTCIRTGLFNIDYILTYGIMKGSNLILAFSGFNTTIANYSLSGINNISIHMGYPCIGINLMFVFSVFIIFMKGKTINKCWYIVSGIGLIYFMNILRITFLYLYLVKNNNHNAVFVDVHDIYSYTIYLAIFFMWVLWIKKFNTNNIRKI